MKMFVFILTLALFALLSSLLLTAKGRKEQQELMQAVIRLLQTGEAIRDSVPRFLLDDEAATGYCRDVIYRTDAQYVQDTAAANEVIRKAQWIATNPVFPDEKTKAKLIKQKYAPEKLNDIYSWANRILTEVPNRYGTLTAFCDRQLARKREALARTMPEGRLVELRYEEESHAIPEVAHYLLQRDDSSGRWQLNGHEVPDKVAAEVRQLVEERRAYQCFDQYVDVPPFLRGPIVMGGPPAWNFSCRFEGGSFQTRSDDQPVPGNCAVILDYLKDILREICENQPNQN